MKRITALLIALMLLVSLLAGCAKDAPQVVASTAPVCEFTRLLCRGTDISVGQLVTEEVSCLHDYTLQVSQMRMLEAAELIVISGAGLEDFLEDALPVDGRVIDSSVGCHLHSGEHEHEDDQHDHHHDGHHHEIDPHIWLDPENAKIMAANICIGLSDTYPAYEEIFNRNLVDLTAQLDALQIYGEETLSELSCREIITFHDGFGYFAESFDLTILRALEEEAGSEPSARELKELILLVEQHCLNTIFTEVNGSVSAAQIISTQTGAQIYTLSMGMSGQGYFETMYYNINTIKEALE